MLEFLVQKDIIKKSIVYGGVVLLFLVLGFQLWIIRSQGYEITTLRNENITNRADAEDMRRKLIELINDSTTPLPQKNEEVEQGPRYFSEDLVKTYRAEFEEFIKTLESETYNGDFSTSPEMLQEFYEKKNAKVIYADKMIISYRLEFESYTGGAHDAMLICVGTVARIPISPDSRRLTLSDIVNEEQMPELKKRLIQALKEEYARRGSPESANMILDSFAPIENFYYDKDGLHFLFNEYDIGSYAEGSFDLCIAWPLPKSVTWVFTPAGGTDENDLPDPPFVDSPER